MASAQPLNCTPLILSYISLEDYQLQVRSVARIQLAGKGEILLYDENGGMDRLDIGSIQEVTVQVVQGRGSREGAAA